MTTVTREFIGVGKAQSSFVRIETRLTRIKPLLEKVGDEFHSQEQTLFGLAPWKPLKPETEARKARLYGGPTRILVATGSLLRSLTQKGAPGSIFRVGDTEAEFGSAVPHATFFDPKLYHVERDPVAEPDENKYNTLAGEYLAEVVREEAAK